MEETKIPAKTQLALNALNSAISYKDYRALVEQHALEDSNTGEEITESLANYTKLNHKRMKRLAKTTKLNPAVLEKATHYSKKVTWLVITESWCGDAAQTTPVMEKIAEAATHLDLKIVLRDEHPELMDAFLTNGARSIPKLIAIDVASQSIIGDWGPRPTTATALVKNYKEKHGQLTPEFKEELQVWYNKDKGQNTMEDLALLLV